MIHWQLICRIIHRVWSLTAAEDSFPLGSASHPRTLSPLIQEAQARAWVGIENKNVAHFAFTLSKTTARLSSRYKIENFGSSPSVRHSQLLYPCPRSSTARHNGKGSLRSRADNRGGQRPKHDTS